MQPWDADKPKENHVANVARKQKTPASPAGRMPGRREDGDAPARQEETRIWTDPRDGERWTIETTTAKGRESPSRSPRLVVFRRDGRRYWVGYCGLEPLARMDDTDLVLLLDSTSAAV